ncbi:Uu.00g131410.m01.CDS01 [Anthostomella pinea]|uniref:Uu.00g131410.m01.CDS01 n=1 Tax=Anthostomella pinea TaxID=933095 RepID=A0AAI8YIE1_9PEZI|nr:Uu.00g131410.m01.CDS01 [Anthostomella pinea]
MAVPGESFFSWDPPKAKPYVSHGLSFEKACAHHAEQTFHASRVYVIVSKSISKTPAFTALKEALGDKLVGVRYGILPHTPWGDVFELTADLKAKEVDLIITLGGGSISDGVKLARLFVANGVTTTQGVDVLWEKCNSMMGSQPAERDDVKPATIPCINVPTTLSGGEFTPAGGATDPKTHHKRVLRHESMYADIVVFDPSLSVSTPAHVWLSTGVRAVDHCIEGLYANAPDARPEISPELINALRTLLVSLLQTKKNWYDTEARLKSMLAVKDSIKGVFNGIGASHGIGHQLGPMGVGHGETSCVMLPYVLKYNWQHGDEKVRDQLRPVLGAFWDEPTVVEQLDLKDLDRGSADPGDLVAAFVEALGMPRSLGHFGVGKDRFELLADNAMEDWCTIANPVKLDKAQVVEILQMAA